MRGIHHTELERISAVVETAMELIREQKKTDCKAIKERCCLLTSSIQESPILLLPLSQTKPAVPTGPQTLNPLDEMDLDIQETRTFVPLITIANSPLQADLHQQIDFLKLDLTRKRSNRRWGWSRWFTFRILVDLGEAVPTLVKWKIGQ